MLKVKGFQDKLLKNHWASRMDIIAEGINSIIFEREVQKI
jgi:hypothetical protein